MRKASSRIPQTVWERWNSPLYTDLRRFIYIFGSSTSKEVPIRTFENVMFFVQEGEDTKLVEGTFYVTTKRFVFVPKDSAAIANFVTAEFQSISKLCGASYDLSMSVTNFEMGVANFQFGSRVILFVVFGLLKELAETVRLDKNSFVDSIVKILEREELEQKPFSCIDCEFEEVENDWVLQEENAQKHLIIWESGCDDDLDSHMIKSFGNLFVYMHFDIHIKLRILFIISLITFCLKFIPFLPLVFLIMICTLLYNAWKKLNAEGAKNQTKDESEENSSVLNGNDLLRTFVNNWFLWNDFQKSSKLLKISLFMFSVWAVMDKYIYYTVYALFFVFFTLKPIFTSSVFRRIINGFWFCT